MEQEPQQLWVPVVGDLVRVAKEPWTINLMEEHRNIDFLKRIGQISASTCRYSHNQNWHTLHVPVGTLLAFDRLYIRKGLADFNSVTFILKGDSPDPKWKSGRFWVSTDDANRMFYVRGDRTSIELKTVAANAAKERLEEHKEVLIPYLCAQLRDSEACKDEVFRAAPYRDSLGKTPWESFLQVIRGSYAYKFRPKNEKKGTRQVDVEWFHYNAASRPGEYHYFTTKVEVSYKPGTDEPLGVKVLRSEERTPR